VEMKIQDQQQVGIDNILFRILAFWCSTFSSRLLLCIKIGNVLSLLVDTVVFMDNPDIFASVNVVPYALLLHKFQDF
jgi:hypothetical protein